MKVRTRMAPSPTGEYHIGHIRTVLYNYALAKKNNGQFLIRIEDTDRERYVEGAVDRILDVIKEYGLTWDEGPRVGGGVGPYIQSERLEFYKKYALELVEKGHAYYCFCSSERLTQVREEQQQQGLPVTKYDRHCLTISSEDIHKNLEAKIPYVIRLKVPNNEVISFTDEVLGTISVNSNDIDDQVLLKSDSFPTYQLAVVIDDHLMDITHVMRGSDWVPSTPKHVLLYRAFGWEMPKHIHLPNLKELGGSKKLSKRFGSVAAIEFLQEGYLPAALLNFLMFLGWNPGTERELYTVDEFVKDFSLERLQKTDLVAFDREKLAWFNAQYIRSLSTEALWDDLMIWSYKYGEVLPSHDSGKDYHLQVLSLVQDRMRVLSDFTKLTKYFYNTPLVTNESLSEFCGSMNRANEILREFNIALQQIDICNWNSGFIDTFSHELIEKKEWKPKEAFMTLRIAITGEKATPPIFDIIALFGKETTLKRISNCLL